MTALAAVQPECGRGRHARGGSKKSSSRARTLNIAESLVAETERLLRQPGCPKINLQIRATNDGVMEFYPRLGYSVDDVVSVGKRLGRDDKTT